MYYDQFMSYSFHLIKGHISCFPGSIMFGYVTDVDEGLFAKLLKKNGVENCNFFAAVPRLLAQTWIDKPNEYRTYEVLCEAAWDDGNVCAEVPRYLARKQLELLRHEFGYRLTSAFECEFQVLNRDTLQPEFNSKDYLSNLRMNESIAWLYDVEKHVRPNGVDVRSIHAEYAEGQFEVTFMPQDGLQTADSIFIFKQAIKEIARQHGKLASFMTKIFKLGACNGQHFNHSLWNDENESVFWDASKPDKLSDVARHWIGGTLKHFNAITALCCPTVNCYRRLHTIIAPDRANWSIDDRHMALRVVNTSAGAMRLENRLPSSPCNPYLVLAATVAAGIDGLRNKIEPPPAGSNEDAAKLPHTLEQALTSLEADDVIKAALGDEFVTAFTMLKRNIECKKFKEHDMKKFIDAEVAAEIDDYLVHC